MTDTGTGKRTTSARDSGSPSERKGWRYGLCIGMGGCAWAQFNDEPRTYKHFATEAEARAFADGPRGFSRSVRRNGAVQKLVNLICKSVGG